LPRSALFFAEKWIPSSPSVESRFRLFEQILRVDKWSLCRD